MQIASIIIVMIGVAVYIGTPSVSAVSLTYINTLSTPDLVTVIDSVVRALRTFFLPFAALGIVVMGVWLIVAAASGNQAQTQTAKKFLFWAVIGAAIVAGAVVLVEAARQFGAGLG